MSLISEFKRRKVLPVFAAYAVVAWGVIEVIATVSPLLGMPDWVPRLVTVLAILGFPLAIALAWFYDFQRPGIERTTQAEPALRPAMVRSATSIRGPNFRTRFQQASSGRIVETAGLFDLKMMPRAAPSSGFKLQE